MVYKLLVLPSKICRRGTAAILAILSWMSAGAVCFCQMDAPFDSLSACTSSAADWLIHQDPQANPLQAAIEQARQEYQAAPDDADKLIWYGRRLAYAGRHLDAIDVYTTGHEKFPADARMLRHRGHRWITTKQFDKAIDDLKRAAELVQGQTDQIEPDGQPNAAGIPTSTLQTNIYYHLGLAYFLTGDFERARAAYEHCLAISPNDDMRVATLDWLYMTLRRLGQVEEAAKRIQHITPELKLLENHAYHQRILMYRGLVSPEELLSPPDPASGNQPANSAHGVELATYGFGVGHWYLLQGDKSRAREIFKQVVAAGNPAAFGSLAAEVELGRFEPSK